MGSIEERIGRLEVLLKLLLRRIESIENLLLVIDANRAEIVRLAMKLVMVFSIPVFKALDLASNITSICKTYGIVDDISRTIIEVLAVRNEASISELTRLVRLVRGRASRRIIAERVRKLNRLGIVSIKRKGNKITVKLRTLGSR